MVRGESVEADFDQAAGSSPGPSPKRGPVQRDVKDDDGVVWSPEKSDAFYAKYFAPIVEKKAASEPDGNLKERLEKVAHDYAKDVLDDPTEQALKELVEPTLESMLDQETYQPGSFSKIPAKKGGDEPPPAGKDEKAAAGKDEKAGAAKDEKTGEAKDEKAVEAGAAAGGMTWNEGEDETLSPDNLKQELAARDPDLAGICNALNAAWLSEFMGAPNDFQTGVTEATVDSFIALKALLDLAVKNDWAEDSAQATSMFEKYAAAQKLDKRWFATLETTLEAEVARFGTFCRKSTTVAAVGKDEEFLIGNGAYADMSEDGLRTEILGALKKVVGTTGDDKGDDDKADEEASSAGGEMEAERRNGTLVIKPESGSGHQVAFKLELPSGKRPGQLEFFDQNQGGGTASGDRHRAGPRADEGRVGLCEEPAAGQHQRRVPSQGARQLKVHQCSSMGRPSCATRRSCMSLACSSSWAEDPLA